jgi:hypothetical protein
MESEHEINDAESSENIMDTIKKASHYKSGSQKEKLMDAIQHFHPRPLTGEGQAQLQYCHMISQNELPASRLEKPTGNALRWLHTQGSLASVFVH